MSKLPPYKLKETESQKLRNLYEEVGSQPPFTQSTQNSDRGESDEELIGSSQPQKMYTPKSKRSVEKKASSSSSIHTSVKPGSDKASPKIFTSTPIKVLGKNVDFENEENISQNNTSRISLNERYVVLNTLLIKAEI